MIDYKPSTFDKPKTVNVTSAWEPMARIILDIITRFNIGKEIALEFGVERGFSTSAFSNYFRSVIGVDPFDWEFADGNTRDYKSVAEGLKQFPNIHLVMTTSDEFIKTKLRPRWDLIHIDIGYETHSYETTFPCGEWAVQHSDCVLFHDTLSFPGVMKACLELAAKYKFDFYNYSEKPGPAGIVCGLGILIKKP